MSTADKRIQSRNAIHKHICGCRYRKERWFLFPPMSPSPEKTLERPLVFQGCSIKLLRQILLGHTPYLLPICLRWIRFLIICSQLYLSSHTYLHHKFYAKKNKKRVLFHKKWFWHQNRHDFLKKIFIFLNPFQKRWQFWYEKYFLWQVCVFSSILC